MPGPKQPTATVWEGEGSLFVTMNRGTLLADPEWARLINPIHNATEIKDPEEVYVRGGCCSVSRSRAERSQCKHHLMI